MNLNPSETQIPKQIAFSSSNSNANPFFISPSIPQIQSQFHSISKIHFEINPNQPQIQNPSTPIHQTQIENQNQTHFQYEPINQNPQNTKTHISIPQKRSLMTQNPPPNPRYNTHKLNPSFSSKSPFSIQIPTKELAFKLCSRLRHARWRLRLRFRFFLLLSLPSLYFFLSNPHGSVAIDIVSIFAFFIALLISLYFALPSLPSICPIKLNSSPPPSNPSPPVLWSIGSNPKLEKLANSGCGVQVYSNGDVYEGEFYKGKCSGSGVYYYYMSGKYEGDWIDEKYDGYGVETWARGSRYRGQYRQGLRHGVGVYRFYTGDGYGGEWCNGQSHGCGVHTCEDGSRYVGEFKWGVKHGLGHYHFRNGDTYAGEYFADKMHGFGVYRFGNGHHYEGAWHEGRRQGLGTYTFRNGETQSGHWQNGVLDVRSTQNATDSPVSVIHSKVLNTVQEARRAAEKAYNTAKVEERVNKAVAAANKSANAARVAAVKAVQNRMYETDNNQHLPISTI